MTFKNRAAKTAAVIAPTVLLVWLGVVVARHLSIGAPPAAPPLCSSRPVRQVEPREFLLGVREHDTPGPWAPISQFAAAAGARPRLVLIYTSWKQKFRYGFAKTAAAHCAVVIVQMQPWSVPLSAIAAGHYDGYLSSYARQVRTFHRPVVIGFGHEVNGNWYPWGHGHQSPAAFVAAWRHVVTVFRRQHAGNAIWLWTISSGVPRGRQLRPYWPGAHYVNWVGVDGYYEQKGQNFSSVFGHTIRQVRALTKDPILLSEAAIGPAAGRSASMPNLFTGIRRDHLLGLVWFDVTQSGDLSHQNWRMEGHPAEVAAFKHGVAQLLPSSSKPPGPWAPYGAGVAQKATGPQ